MHNSTKETNSYNDLDKRYSMPKFLEEVWEKYKNKESSKKQVR